jgi:FkbM family methyltransferase
VAEGKKRKNKQVTELDFMKSFLKKFKNEWRYLFSYNGEKPTAEPFLFDVDAVIHLGANQGQEREKYWKYGLKVDWIEAIPTVYDTLQKNIRFFRNQKAFQGLITNEDGKEYVFNIASNQGESSSIYDLKEHQAMWPHIHYVDKITVKSLTLPEFLKQNKIQLSAKQGLLIDAQGAEYVIIQGAEKILKNFTWIIAETATFEWYKGAHCLNDVVEIMRKNGFTEESRKLTKSKEGIGECYDILFRNEQSRRD